LNKADYAVYLASPDWRTRREKLLAAHGNRCGLCGVPRMLARAFDGADLNVHHLRYDTIGEEKPDDVEARCDTCHKATEKQTPARTFRDELEWAVVAWLWMLAKWYGIQAREAVWEMFSEAARENELTVGEVDCVFAGLFRGSVKAFSFARFEDACEAASPKGRQRELPCAAST
jgi:hypothetical protein